VKDTLATGLSLEVEYPVTADLSPAHLAPTVVLSTPNMIELMEGVSLQVSQPHLDETETTVGTHVNVSHEAAARGGQMVTVRSELIVVDRRRLTFSVSAMVETRVIGRGTHERAVIDTSLFGG
jgi:fluoroacetyl-CoA thioesterase